MRRKDRAVTDLSEIFKIIGQCKTCHLAMIDGETPYVVPLSFGYALDGGVLTLYFHSAKAGKKLDCLKRNSRVCFEMCQKGDTVFDGPNPCSASTYFDSVIGFGTAVFIEDPAEKCRALTLLMQHQTGRTFSFSGEAADGVCVFKVTATDVSGKRKARPVAD